MKTSFPTFFKIAILICFTSIFIDSEAQTNKRTLVVIAHPAKESFNHALKTEIVNGLIEIGHEVQIRDLYEYSFDAVLGADDWRSYSDVSKETAVDVRDEQLLIQWADHLIFIYPTWWWGPPAILKGYLDRVLLPGFAYLANEEGIKGLLTDKKVYIFQTTGSDKEFLQSSGFEKSIKEMMRTGVFGFCGAEVMHHEFIPEIQSKNLEERKKILSSFRPFIHQLFQ